MAASETPSSDSMIRLIRTAKVETFVHVVPANVDGEAIAFTLGGPAHGIVAAAGADTGDDSREVGEHRTQGIGDLLAAPLPLRQRNQVHPESHGIGVGGSPTSARTDLHQEVVEFGNQLPHQSLRLVRQLVRHLQTGPFGQFQTDPDLTLVRLRLQLETDEGQQQKPAQHQHGAGENDQNRVPQGPAENARIAPVQSFHPLSAFSGDRMDPPFAFGWPDANEAAGEKGNQSQRHQEGAEQREGDHPGQLLEHETGHAAHEDDRQEYGNGGESRRSDGESDFLGCVAGRRLLFLAILPVPEDVLQHDDGVVHEHADPQCKTAEGDHVQREPAEVHQTEGGQHRNGDGDGHHQHTTEVAQEHQENEDGEERTVEGGVPDVGHRPADELGGVVKGVDPDLRIVPIDPLDGPVHLSRHQHGVGTGLLADAHPDARDAVDPYQMPNFLMAVLDRGDVLDIDGGALPNGHHGSPDLVHRGVLALGPHQHFERVLDDVSGRLVQILAAQCGHDLGRADAESMQLGPVHHHVDLTLQTSPDIGLGHAGNPLEPVLDLLFREFTQLPGRQLAGDSQKHDGEDAQIVLVQGRRIRILGQLSTNAVDPGAEFFGACIQVHSPLERDPHAAGPLGGPGGHLLDAGGGGQGPFQRNGDQFFDLPWPHALIGGGHADGGKSDVRHQVDGEIEKGDPAHEGDDEEDDNDEDGAPDRQVGKTHSDLTASPSFKFWAPEATTSAPSCKPARTSTTSPSMRPISISRNTVVRSRVRK